MELYRAIKDLPYPHKNNKWRMQGDGMLAPLTESGDIDIKTSWWDTERLVGGLEAWFEPIPEEPELLPCINCQSTDTEIGGTCRSLRYYCTNCMLSGPVHNTKEDAAREWNTLNAPRGEVVDLSKVHIAVIGYS